MPKISFHALDIRQAELFNKQVILLFGRDSNNEKICVIDDSFMPYFYVIPKTDTVKDKILKLEIEIDKHISKVSKTEHVEKKLLGKNIKAVKVTVPFHKDIKAIKSIIEEWEIIDGIYEHDIPFARRYMIDNNIKMSYILEADIKEVNAGFKAKTFIGKNIVMSSKQSTIKPRILALNPALTSLISASRM
jgi:DNA polymerase I